MRVGWTTDRTAAYLYDDSGNVTARWISGRPDLSTFNPQDYPTAGAATPAYGGGTAAAPTGGTTGTITPTGFYEDPELIQVKAQIAQWGITNTQVDEAAAENRRQFDQDLAYRQQALAQEAAIAREQIAATTGNIRLEWENRLRQTEMQIASNEQIANLDRGSREKIADKEFATRIQEMMSRERITAAQTWANPIDYLAYNKWMSGQQAMTTESGLPVGAPEFQTGQPAAATVGAGGVATGGADVYGQQLAAGGRMPSFSAWGGPTTPVGGTPWVAPAQTNLTQFANMPNQAQQMAYARWRQRGVTPETANQFMTAAAPTGTAGRVTRYG
jgi:hypothetical protein